MEYFLTSPLTRSELIKLKYGDRVLLTGVVYTARDAAHKKLCDLIESGLKLPINCSNSVIYYTGPTPTPPDCVIGSAGPTSSYRMDPYAEALMKKGVCIMIGKGKRGDAFNELCRKYGAVYLGAVGGCGALISQCITSCETVAYDELGSEAVRKLYVKNMPLTVITDTNGDCLFDKR